MAELTPSQIAGLVTATLDELGERKITDISTRLQQYCAVDLINSNQTRIDSGKAITFNVRTDFNSDATKAVSMFDVEQPTITDNLTTATIPWRFWKKSLGYEDREVAINSGKRQIIDLITERYDEAEIGYYEQWEDWLWGAAPLESDTKTPYGVNTYLVTNSSEGFNGDKPSTWTNYPAGLNNARYRNYTGTYSAYDYDGLVKKIRRMADYTHFTNPHKGNMADYSKPAPKALYTTYNVVDKLRDAVRDQNDALGFDLAAGDNPLFRGNPLKVVWKFNETAPAVTDPVYLIDWAHFRMTTHPTYNGKKIGPVKLGQQLLTNVVRWDWMGNIECRDRRRQGVIYYSA